MNTPTLIPTSRRFSRDEWHPYGWKVTFRQTVRFADGQTERRIFSAIGVNRDSAIGNALRILATMSPRTL